MSVKKILGMIGMVSLGISLIIIFQGSSNATETGDTKAIIMVSGQGGYSESELAKASCFREYLLDTSCTEGDIIYLTSASDPDSDGIANLSNIEDAFDWLGQECGSETEIVIYVLDHEYINDQVYFQFDDGSISAYTIDSWLDQTSYSSVTIILNGERSGLAGSTLNGANRDVLCSMEANQFNIPDLFNISRSLVDPSADMNTDGIVDYIEAFWKEVERLQRSGQDPILYYVP
jgi:hypothetical protein